MAASTLVQSAISCQTGGSNPYTTFHIYLPQPALAGNCLLLAVAYTGSLNNTSATPAVTDDNGGNTWNAGPADADATNVYNLRLFYALNVAAGTRRITVTMSGDTAIAFEMLVAEFNNIATSAATDTAGAHTHGVSASWQSGSFTTAVDGDLIFQAAVSDTGAVTMTADTGNGYAFLVSDSLDGMSAQWAVQGTHGATNPTITASTSTGFISCTLALKNASAGSPADTTVPHIASIHHFTAAGTSQVFQVPTRGKLLVGVFIGDGLTVVPAVSTVTDGHSNSYVVKTKSGTTLNGGMAQTFYVLSPTTDNKQSITVTYSTNVDAGSNVWFYDVDYTGTFSFDTVASATGNDTVGGDLTTVTITPSAAGGIVIGGVSVQSGLMEAATGTGQFADQTWTPDSTGNSPYDEDNGLAHVFPSSVAAIPFKWHDRGVQADNWAAQAISFAIPAVAGPPPRDLPHSPLFQSLVAQ